MCYENFGDFARADLGMQCQYASRYIHGKIEGWPELGNGLRFKNLNSCSYHFIEIHCDDKDEFARRVKEYVDERSQF